LETNSGKGVNVMQIVGELQYFVVVGSPGGASMEGLISQLPEDVIGSGLNKDDPGRAPLPSAFHHREGMSPGASSKESVKQRCVFSLKQ
jgi:hypothetical protein